MIESIDILFAVRDYIIDPLDFFRLRSSVPTMRHMSNQFPVKVTVLVRYLGNRSIPIHDLECDKLEVIYDSTAPGLSRSQIDILLHGIAPGCGKSLFCCLVKTRAVEPYLLYDSAIKSDRSDIALTCVAFFPFQDSLRIWRRLRAAVIRGYVEVVKTIVGYGISIETLEADSDPLLHGAISHHQAQIVDYLLSLDASLVETDSDGLTPFLLACKLHQGTIIRQIIAKDPTVIRQRDHEGRSCMILALLFSSMATDASVIDILVESGADCSTVVMPNGMLAIQYACAMNRIDIVKVLESRGISLQQTDALGRSCLDVCHMSFPMVSYLISRRLGPNHQVDFLGKAAAHNEIDTCRLFAELGVHLREPESLLAAVSTTSDNAKCVDFLISLRVNVNAQSSNGETPLYRSVVYHNRGACECLLAAGADPHTEFKGMSVVAIAEREGYLDIAELLANYGAMY